MAVLRLFSERDRIIDQSLEREREEESCGCYVACGSLEFRFAGKLEEEKKRRRALKFFNERKGLKSCTGSGFSA